MTETKSLYCREGNDKTRYYNFSTLLDVTEILTFLLNSLSVIALLQTAFCFYNFIQIPSHFEFLEWPIVLKTLSNSEYNLEESS